MAEDSPPKDSRHIERRDDRVRRQAEALRANLRRRKAQATKPEAPTAPLPPQRIG